MYDINTSNVKKGKKFFLLFLVVGIVFLVIMLAIVISNFTKLNSLDGKTLSSRIEVHEYFNDEGQTMYSPVYYYVVHEKEYSCSSNSSSSIHPGNENKTVYYDTKNPAICMTEYSKNTNWILIAVMILPIIFIIIGVINIKKIGKRAFKGTSKKMIVKLKKKYRNKYKKLLKKAGIYKKTKYRKL